MSITVAAIVLVVAGVMWGVRGGGFSAPAPSASSTVIALPQPVDPVALEKEIEDLKAMRSHLLPPLPAANPDAFRIEQGAGTPQPSGNSGVGVQLSAPSRAVSNSSYRYTAPQASSGSQVTPNATYTYSSSASSYPVSNGYTYNPTYGPPSQNVTSTPPAPVFLAAPGTRTYTATTNKRFCDYAPGLSEVFLSGYPFPQDVEIFQQDILKWAMTQVTFRLPGSFPVGTYMVIVRGHQKYGYCDDVKPGFIKVQ